MFNIFKRKPKVIPATEPVKNFEGCRLKREASYLMKQPKPEGNFGIFASMGIVGRLGVVGYHEFL